jgi:hypothetical protein
MNTRCLIAIFGVVAALPPTFGDWVPVAVGFDYQEFTVAGPNNVFVVRMHRADTGTTIDSMLGQGRLTGGTETVPSMAAKQEDALSYWGQSWGPRYEVVAAINGDFFSAGIPYSGQICGGWYAKRFTDFTGGSGFAWQLDREAFVGECVRHIASKQVVTYLASGNTQNFHGVNRPRGEDELVLYTHHYDLTTGTAASGVEVLVELTRPTLILPLPNGALGTVVEIRENAGSTLIPFDHIVLSAQGAAAGTLLGSVSLGSQVRIAQEITHYEHDCSTSIAWDWTKTYASIGASFHFLRQGILVYDDDPGATERHPRTAIALNEDYVYFVVVDGRSSISVGMSLTELGEFCLAYLAADEGLNQDGGGSSLLWLQGEVMNVPSDGQPRPVANGMFMARTAPLELSTRFIAGDAVRVGAPTSVRIGPGDNYTSAGTAGAGAHGTVLAHTLSGVRARHTHWWKCDFGTLIGWVADEALLVGGCVGDFNADGQVSGGDLPHLIFCLQGPDLLYASGHVCLRGDADGDADLDLADWAVMQSCISPG